MIIGSFIACGTCKKNYRARIQVGIKDIQEFNFMCLECSEPIHLSLELGTGVVFGENCVEGSSINATPHYLSDDIIPTAEEVNSPNSFPSLRFMDDVTNSISFKKLISANAKPRKFNADSARNPKSEWDELKKAWRLQRSGQEKLSRSILKKFSKSNSYPEELDGALFQFAGSIRIIDEDLMKEVVSIRNDYPDEFKRYVKHYIAELRQPQLKGYYEIIGEYFNLFHEFSKTFLYAKFNTKIPENAIVASGNFDKVKRFYASCYEFYAASLFNLTCMNNIKLGRSFDKLGQIDLKKYLTIDKAKRRDNFIGDPIFEKASREFDNGIRNASFHQWMQLSDDNMKVEYKSGGTGDLISLSYAEYLEKCSIIFLQTCMLFQLELILFESSKHLFRNESKLNKPTA